MKEGDFVRVTRLFPAFIGMIELGSIQKIDSISTNDGERYYVRVRVNEDTWALLPEEIELLEDQEGAQLIYDLQKEG